MSILSSTHSGEQVPISTELLLKEGYLKQSNGAFTGFANYVKTEDIWYDTFQEVLGYAIRIQWCRRENKEFFEYTFPCPRNTGVCTCKIRLHTLADLRQYEKYDRALYDQIQYLNRYTKTSQAFKNAWNEYNRILDYVYNEIAKPREDSVFLKN